MRLARVLVVAALTGACAGPSRARYAELLGECRAANREHLRMIQEYDAAKCDRRPEQISGAAEMGLGGY